MIVSGKDVLDDLGAMIGRPQGELDEAVIPAPVSPAYSTPDPMTSDLPGDAREGVLAALGPAPAHIDDLVRATGLTVGAIQIALIELDLAGRLDHHGAQLVSLKVETPD